MDNFLRELIDKEIKIGKITLSFMDLLLLSGMTVAGILIRFIFKSIVTDDWSVFWDPWIKELQVGGFKSLSTDFYDYAPPFMYVLYFISILPINPMTAYKGISCIFDFIAAIVAAGIIFDITKSKTRAIGVYSVFMIMPTMIANSALWAQCDIIYTTFVLLSILYIMKDKPNLAMLFYGIAFAFKLQTLFIFPLFIILWAKNRVKIKHFTWIAVMYALGILPAWIAGRPLIELINIYVAQGTQDAYSLSLKWSNIYQIFGPTFFIEEYEKAGIWLIVGILMLILFFMAYKKYKLTKEFILLVGFFFAMITAYFLPHMHERYGFLADIFAILYAFTTVKRFYYPLIHIILSFSAYLEYLSKAFAGPIPYYALVELGLIILAGRDIYYYITSEDNKQVIDKAVANG
ncbi:MAG: glycosyltransferase 87 family protein [Lachnotalea sp.]